MTVTQIIKDTPSSEKMEEPKNSNWLSELWDKFTHGLADTIKKFGEPTEEQKKVKEYLQRFQDELKSLNTVYGEQKAEASKEAKNKISELYNSLENNMGMIDSTQQGIIEVNITQRISEILKKNEGKNILTEAMVKDFTQMMTNMSRVNFHFIYSGEDVRMWATTLREIDMIVQTANNQGNSVIIQSTTPPSPVSPWIVEPNVPLQEKIMEPTSTPPQEATGESIGMQQQETTSFIFQRPMNIDDKVESPKVITIEMGDTLTSIAKKYMTTVDALVRLNNIKFPDKIRAGKALRIPANKNGENSSTIVNYPPGTKEVGGLHAVPGSQGQEDMKPIPNLREVGGPSAIPGSQGQKDIKAIPHLREVEGLSGILNSKGPEDIKSK